MMSGRLYVTLRFESCVSKVHKSSDKGDTNDSGSLQDFIDNVFFSSPLDNRTNPNVAQKTQTL